MIDSLVVQKLRGDDRLDDMLHQILMDLLVAHVVVVLIGDNDRMNTNGDHMAVIVLVLNGNLSLTVRTNPLKGSILTNIGKSLAKFRGEKVGQRHQLLRLVAGVAKHDALITSADLLHLLVDMHSLRNIRRLVLDGHDHVAVIAIEALGIAVIANLSDRVTNHLLPFHLGSGCDLSEDHHHLPLSRGLAGYFSIGVLGQAGVKDGIGDLITQLVYGLSAPRRIIPGCPSFTDSEVNRK